MSLARTLLVIFLFPLVDLALLGWIAAHVPLDALLLWVVGTAVLGVGVLRGVRSGRGTDDVLLSGKPSDLADRVSLIVAGILLVLPGVMGDLLGLVLLIPWLRRPLAAWTVRRLIGRLRVDIMSRREPAGRSGHVIDVHAVDPTAPHDSGRGGD